MPSSRPVRSTYRLQISADFTLDDAARRVPYIAGLGVTHLYLSPLLRAAPGSMHGYDVLDHAHIDDGRGGEEALRALADVAHAAGLGLVLDVVPNHMSVAVPRSNAAWWDVLRFGPESAYAHWFDVDWDAGPVLLPVLGSDDDIDKVEVVVEDDGPELAYFEHRFPIAPGTDAGSPAEVHDRQAYRLVGWRREAELTYRRFFDVSSLAGLRIEDRGVYDATHELLLRLVREGIIDGLRIDHPDGLEQPGEYLEWLAEDTGDAWVVVEKILEPGERLPANWHVAGTTGYDAARLVGGVFVDPAGAAELTALWQRFTGDTSSFGEKVLTAKRAVTTGVLAAEVARLHRLAPDIAVEAIAEVLAQFPVYRSYLPDAGAEHLEQALAHSRAARPELDFERLAQRLADAEDPLSRRFQQTSGMVMAKGVEDTAFYRHHILDSLNEVGGDPARFGVSVEEFHAEAAALQENWPDTMTLLSSHDTKRSEDVRARITLLSQDPTIAHAIVANLDRDAAPYHGKVAPEDRYLLHQTILGIGLIDPDRVVAYLEKATREAKLHTSWTDPDPEYDHDVEALVRGILADPPYRTGITTLLRTLESAWWRTLLAQKLLQLTMPGIPDLYQGSERVHLALVDPDNRRPVDWDARADAKTAVVRTVLRLRRDHPELFTGYQPVLLGTANALAFLRSQSLLVVVNRFVLSGSDAWNGAELALPPGEWRDELGGEPIATTIVADLLRGRPGLLLRRVGS